MDQEPLHQLIRSLRRRVAQPSDVRLTDAQLLERFVTARDEAAFELLLWRHGSMVLGVCRRVLRNAADVEDAFQATFLALARKAATLRRPEALGSWLYQVAHRVALRARAVASRQARWLVTGVENLPAPAGPAPDSMELHELLSREIAHLPEHFRAAFVLCCVEGMTTNAVKNPGLVFDRSLYLS